MISNKSNHHLHHNNHNNITINSVVAKKRNNSKKSREIVGGVGGGLIIRGSSISGSGATRISQNSSQISSQKSQHFRRSQNHRTSGASYMAQTVSTTTCTKTLVSLKSCRSLSEIETLPPTGYFASTVVQSTYVNDDFVSDNEEDQKNEKCEKNSRDERNPCCKER